MAKGVVSKQENDQYQAQYQAQQANVDSLGKAIAAARGNVERPKRIFRGCGTCKATKR